MVERGRRPTREPEAVLRIRDLSVRYGRSHVLQGIDLTLEHGVVSIVGRNGMGKTTLCKAIMGLVAADRGTIGFEGQELRGRTPSQIANLGIGYVPQGRRLWRSLTVDEHLRLCSRGGSHGGWSIERVYDTFPRLAERRDNGGAQLSGGEQQMLAIARALLANPRLLVMDEPTEGLAPVIVAQVETMLVRLGEEEGIAVLVIEQNIGVATAVSDTVAIMVNGRINRVMDSAQLAADRDLQQRLLGVGRHGAEDALAAAETTEVSNEDTPSAAVTSMRRGAGRRDGAAPPLVYMVNPTTPTRWSPDVSLDRIMAASEAVRPSESASATIQPLHASVAPRARPGGTVLVVGTLDTKGVELKFIRDCITRQGVRTRLVDLSTSGKPSGSDVPPHQVAAYHRRGANAVFAADRGEAIKEMALAFENWIVRQGDVAGIISAGGSGGTALATPGMRRLPLGVPKLMISTVASGNVAQYVGGADIMMMYSVADVQGLNRISREVLTNGANAIAGMVSRREPRAAERTGRDGTVERPSIGITMFGVTTPCVQRVAAALDQRFECLVFHATGTGGQSMEGLVDAGLLSGVLDLTTTEVADLLVGGTLPAHEDRFGSIVRSAIPYVGSCGALDMVNFGPLATVPREFAHRLLHSHNPAVTLMRTTPEENAGFGRWIGERLNRMTGPVRFLLPTGGVSMLDAPGKPFHDPAADEALFASIEATVRQNGKRQVARLPFNINDPPFADAAVAAFQAMTGVRARRRAAGS